MNDPPIHASILAVIRDGPSGPEVLLTERAARMRRGAGEISLPGGKREKEDGGTTYTRTLGRKVNPMRWTVDVTTALRESFEEVGLDPDDVEVIAELPRCVALGGLLTTPVVAWYHGNNSASLTKPRLAPEEVASAFWMPLDSFLRAENHKHKDILMGTVRMHYFEHADVKVFGLTANVMIRIAQLALGREPAFEMFLGTPQAKL